jgi:hypothetical protein
MNANEISPKASPRLQRIQKVSRIVRYVFLGLFVLSIVNFLFHNFPTLQLAKGHMTTAHEHPVWSVLVFLSEAVLWVWFWKLAKLFHFYERGMIFATATIRCIKTLGLLCIIAWLLSFVLHTLFHQASPPPPFPLPPGYEVHIVDVRLGLGFFSFSLGGINLGSLLAGVVIVLVAWIMDEGRKIQEEQELTV